MSEDSELNAIQQLLSALEPLDTDARGRVIDYVFQRLDIGRPGPVAPPAESQPATSGTAQQATELPQEPASPGTIIDIRTFAAEKQPASQMEKTVFVAFYLAEVAPEAERKAELTGPDLAKYQKQAGLGAPTNTRHALFLARDSGYLESAGHGKYKLNAVGYNFVSNNLPSAQGQPRPVARKTTRRKKTAHKKSAAKKASRKKPSRKR